MSDLPGSYDLPSVDFITVGTVGPPGQRIFYIQARVGMSVLSFKLEKTQVAALAKALAELLADLPPVGGIPIELALIEPVDAEWVTGTIGLGAFDDATQRATMLLEELVAEDEPARQARFGVTREQMAAIVGRGLALLEGGRPNCPLCGFPIDPDGHACPKTNGHLKH